MSDNSELINAGRIPDDVRREFTAYMSGYARGRHSMNAEDIRAEATRYAFEDDSSLPLYRFGDVTALINTVTFRIMERMT